MRLDLLNTLFSGTLALLAVLIRLGAQSVAGEGASEGENVGGDSAALNLPTEWLWLKWFAAAAFDPALIGLALTYLIQMGDAFQVRQISILLFAHSFVAHSLVCSLNVRFSGWCASPRKWRTT
jgi:hypothetical protein